MPITTRYQFPSVKDNGEFYNLDLTHKVRYHFYYVMVAEGLEDTMLSQAEKAYNLGLFEYITIEKEVRRLINKNDILEAKILKSNQLLEQLKSSFWSYIKFRFKSNHE